MKIRTATDLDWNDCWHIIQPVFAAGDTYPYGADISSDEAKSLWLDVPLRTYVATNDAGQIVGTYYLKQNQIGRGSHVCNCGYIVSPIARGKGFASIMCEHSQSEAIRFGFSAMQFNLVVATNVGAVRLWQKLGFEIIGTLPKDFNHADAGLVDAHIMYKQLQ